MALREALVKYDELLWVMRKEQLNCGKHSILYSPFIGKANGVAKPMGEPLSSEMGLSHIARNHCCWKWS